MSPPYLQSAVHNNTKRFFDIKTQRAKYPKVTNT